MASQIVTHNPGRGSELGCVSLVGKLISMPELKQRETVMVAQGAMKASGFLLLPAVSDREGWSVCCSISYL